jgi:hypothetical protein
MKMFGAIRRARHAQLSQTIGQPAASASLAAAAAKEASQAAREAKGPGWIAGQMWLLCLVFLVGGVLLIIFATSAFNDPSAVSANSGDIGVGIQTSASTNVYAGPFSQADIVGIDANFVPDTGYANFGIVFPKKFAGRHFVLLLQGSAIIAKPSGHGTALTGGLSKPCALGNGRSKVKQTCELIYGVVPVSSPYIGCLHSSGSSDVINILVSGRSDATQRLDWAHDSVSLPTLGVDISKLILDSWEGIKLSGDVKAGATPLYGLATLEGCKSVSL